MTYTTHYYALDAYVAHCHRAPVDKHPIIWARHTDIWGEAKGEIGIPADVTSVRVASYAAVTPWMICPEIATVELVYDMADAREVALVTIQVDSGGTYLSPRRIPYQITDRGSWLFGESRVKAAPAEVRSSLAIAVMTRMFRVEWEVDYDTALQVAGEMATTYR